MNKLYALEQDENEQESVSQINCWEYLYVFLLIYYYYYYVMLKKNEMYIITVSKLDIQMSFTPERSFASRIISL